MEDSESQEDELLALTSIYDDDTFVCSRVNQELYISKIYQRSYEHRGNRERGKYFLRKRNLMNILRSLYTRYAMFVDIDIVEDVSTCAKYFKQVICTHVTAPTRVT